MSGKLKKLVAGLSALGITLATGITAFASDGGTIISDAIGNAVEGLKSEAGIVIGSAVGLGIIFWGAKLLWSRFKSMAK